jgi:UDP-sulfoquinovose synthase
LKVLVLGGDGFCGWPAALKLSAAGHAVCIVDNLSRRKIDLELEVDSLTPIQPMGSRLGAWREATGKQIRFVPLDVALEYDRLLSLILEVRPEAIVHYAEQRSAPYSMRSASNKRYTVENNVAATHNLLCAIVESGLDIHVVHLGTMGVYGYSGIGPIPEGYVRAKFEGFDGAWAEREILSPADPGSVYHMTKTLDQLLFMFYNKNDQLRITDLHQGVVWGTETEQCKADERLINRFDYDGEYGTVLNRFVVQAAIGHPLTVYGSGGQTRAFIHMRDSVECIRLAVENPPGAKERVRIFNQMTETHRVADLAQIVSRLTGAAVAKVANPRREADKNDLVVTRVGLQSLGLKPTTLEAGLLAEIVGTAKAYAHRVDPKRIASTSFWNAERREASRASGHVKGSEALEKQAD